MDPLQLRLKNAAKTGTQMLSGAKLGARRLSPRPSRRCSTIPATRCRSARTRGAASPSGYWFNGGGESSATVHVNEDGTVVVATGSPDIGGSRASMAIMAAETLGVDYDQVRADRRRHRFGRLHARDRRLARHLRDRHGGGRRHQERDRTTCAARAAKIWEVDPEGVVWEDGHAQAGEQQRRRVRADVDQGDRGEARGDRRADRRRRGRQSRRGRRPATPRSSATSRSIPRPAR